MNPTNHVSYENLIVKKNEVNKLIPIGNTRTHYKNPDVLYEIKDLVIDEATDEVSVVYEKTEDSQSIRFVRLASVFLETVGDGKKRFVRVT